MLNEITNFTLAFYSTLLLYTDPGSGALLLQLVLAAVFGAVFYFRKIKNRLFGKKTSSEIRLPGNNLSEVTSTPSLKSKK